MSMARLCGDEVTSLQRSATPQSRRGSYDNGNYAAGSDRQSNGGLSRARSAAPDSQGQRRHSDPSGGGWGACSPWGLQDNGPLAGCPARDCKREGAWEGLFHRPARPRSAERLSSNPVKHVNGPMPPRPSRKPAQPASSAQDSEGGGNDAAGVAPGKMRGAYLSGPEDMRPAATQKCLKTDLPVSDELLRHNAAKCHEKIVNRRQHTKADLPPSDELKQHNAWKAHHLAKTPQVYLSSADMPPSAALKRGNDRNQLQCGDREAHPKGLHPGHFESDGLRLCLEESHYPNRGGPPAQSICSTSAAGGASRVSQSSRRSERDMDMDSKAVSNCPSRRGGGGSDAGESSNYDRRTEAEWRNRQAPSDAGASSSAVSRSHCGPPRTQQGSKASCSEVESNVGCESLVSSLGPSVSEVGSIRDSIRDSSYARSYPASARGSAATTQQSTAAKNGRQHDRDSAISARGGGYSSVGPRSERSSAESRQDRGDSQASARGDASCGSFSVGPSELPGRSRYVPARGSARASCMSVISSHASSASGTSSVTNVSKGAFSMSGFSYGQNGPNR